MRIQKILTLDFPLFVKWYITEKCNLRCTHCYLTEYTKEPSLDLLKDVITYLEQKKLRHICFLGGEPLVRKDFKQIMEHCSANGIVVKVATNGTLLTPDLCQTLQEQFMLSEENLREIRAKLPILKAKHPQVQLNSAFVSQGDGSSKCATFGCGAGTNSLVINNDMSLSACDILTEEDRTLEKLKQPEEIEMLWRNHEIFRKWRGLEAGKTNTIHDFTEVHQQGCQVAYSTYGKNILADA